MKKIFTLVAMAAVAIAANAQQESAFVDTLALGIKSSAAVDITAGKVFAKSANVTMKAAYNCAYKAVAMNGDSDPFKTITIDGTEYANLACGIQGQTNPTNTKKASSQQPVDNAIFQFDVEADGYLYVFSKLSGNKQYYAFESAYSESTPSSQVAYTIVAGSQKDSKVYTASMPADKDGYVDYTTDTAYPFETIGTYFLCDLVGLRASSDEKYGLGGKSDFTTEQSATLLGVAAFPVYKDGGTYYFMAVGSKVTCDGFVFVPGATEIGAVSISAGAASGISEVATEAAPAKAAKKIVNGQLVIEKNGKKYTVAGAEL